MGPSSLVDNHCFRRQKNLSRVGLCLGIVNKNALLVCPIYLQLKHCLSLIQFHFIYCFSDFIILIFCSTPLPLPLAQTSVGFVVVEFCLLSLLSLTLKLAHILSRENLPNSFFVCVCAISPLLLYLPPLFSFTHIFPTHFNTTPLPLYLSPPRLAV